MLREVWGDKARLFEDRSHPCPEDRVLITIKENNSFSIDFFLIFDFDFGPNWVFDFFDFCFVFFFLFLVRFVFCFFFDFLFDFLCHTGMGLSLQSIAQVHCNSSNIYPWERDNRHSLAEGA